MKDSEVKRLLYQGSEAFEEGIKVGEMETIDKACKWLINIDFDNYDFRDCDESFNNDLFVDAFRKAMEE